MKRLVAFLSLAMAGGAFADDVRPAMPASPPGFTMGSWGGLRLELSAWRARLRIEAVDPVGRSLLALAARVSGPPDTAAAPGPTLDLLRPAGGPQSCPAEPPRGAPALSAGAIAVRVLAPRVVSVPVPLRLPLSGAIRGLLEPSLDVGWATSRLPLSGTGPAQADDAAMPGLGFHLSAGLEMALTDVLGISLKAGWRVLRAPAPDRDALAGTALSPLAAAGEADLGGAYGTFGAVLRI